MRTGWFCLCSVVAALAIVGQATSASAQTDLSTLAPGPKRVDLSGSSGFLLSTDWSDLVLLGSTSTVSGTVEQVLVRDLVVEPGPVFDAVVTYWEGRYGFRVHAGLARSCLAIGANCGELVSAFGGSSSVNVDTWMYDVGGAVGLVDYRRGAPVWPYFFVGLGGVTYDLDRIVSPPLTFIERRPPSETEIIISRDDPNELLISIDELSIETRFAVSVGVGSDFRIPLGPASIGLRLEVSDHIHRSPIGVLVVNVDAFGGARRETPLEFGLVHNLRAAAGLVLQFGR